MALIKNIAALGLGITLSQFPEYSQQYVQRLGGAVDELNRVVDDFDRTASRAGQSREEALASLQGTELLEGRREDMTRTIARQERLSASYDALRNAPPFSRLAQVYRFSDPMINQRAWDDFQPAIPVTVESGSLLLGGYIGLFGFLSGFGRLFRRRQPKAQAVNYGRKFR